MCLAVVIQIPLVESTDDELCSEIQDIVTRGIRELSNQDCGRFGSAKIKKREISPMSRPWMALLISDESKVIKYICTGTLIHKRKFTLYSIYYCITNATYYMYYS